MCSFWTQWVEKLVKALYMSSKLSKMRCLSRRGRSMRRISPRSACRGASLLVLLLLSLPSGQAFASGPGSALPIGAAGTQAGNGVAQSGAPPAPPAVQPAVAPVTGAVTQIVNKATEPVAGGAPTDVKKVTAPVSGAVVQSAGKT